MRIVTLIDSFKGSLTSLQAGNAVAAAARAVWPNAEVAVRPLADGGEGTVEAVVTGCGGEFVSAPVRDPLGREITATYGLLGSGTAVMEMSAAAGITLLAPEERDPARATTYGVGQMIKDAIARGARRFIVGIGGSATNDGGAGMLQALGFDLLNARGEPVAPGAKGLAELACVDTAHALPALSECEFRVACDVTNPLCGPAGCSAVYGPQKGASPASIAAMDRDLARFAELTRAVFPQADPDLPGAGAAGGLGFAFSTYLGAALQSGVSLILETTDAERYVKGADLVITGEGRLDGQTAMGKAPVGVARLAKRHGKPVIAFCGCATDEAEHCNTEGIDAFFPILRGIVTLQEAMEPAAAERNLTATAKQAFRLVRAFRA